MSIVIQTILALSGAAIIIGIAVVVHKGTKGK